MRSLSTSLCKFLPVKRLSKDFDMFEKDVIVVLADFNHFCHDRAVLWFWSHLLLTIKRNLHSYEAFNSNGGQSGEVCFG